MCGRAILSSRNSLCTLLVAALLLGGAAFAQEGGIHAEFAGGGARALAMGGAFIGLADDATASKFNPAGLWQLRRPELALQIMAANDEHTPGRRIRGEMGSDYSFDNEMDRYWIPSFISYVHPTRHVTFAISEFTNVDFDRDSRDPSTGARTHERARNYAFGLSAATAVWRRLSVGATLRYNTFQFDWNEPGVHGRFRDGAVSGNLGLLWRPRRWFSIGAVYKSAQKLTGTYHLGSEDLSVDTELPHTLGMGIALSPNDNWRIVLDVDRIDWSSFDPNPHDDFVRDDAWRYHAGLEWYAGRWRDSAFFLRCGGFHEDPNVFRYTGRVSGLRTLTNSRREGRTHLSAGLGVARPGGQLDAGVDVTLEHGYNLIFSSVWYF